MKNKNKSYEELCAKLGMKYEEASELFSYETLQEMQMAQVCGSAVMFEIAGSQVSYTLTGLRIYAGGAFMGELFISDYCPTVGGYTLSWNGYSNYYTGNNYVTAKSWQLKTAYSGQFAPYDVLYTLEFEPVDGPSGGTCGCGPSCGC